MTDKAGNVSKAVKLRRLVVDERRLIKEKAALEQMLKNVQQMRNKLKVEQIQLSSNLQVELGGQYADGLIKSMPPSPENIEEVEANVLTQKPSLNLNVNDFPGMFLGREDDAEEFEDDSEEEIGCANEVLGAFNETEINFDDF